MAGDEVAAESVAQSQRPLQVDGIACGQRAEVGAGQRLGAGLDTEIGGGVLDDRQAGAVDGDALAEGQFGGERGGEREVHDRRYRRASTRVKVPRASTRPVNMGLYLPTGER